MACRLFPVDPCARTATPADDPAPVAGDESGHDGGERADHVPDGAELAELLRTWAADRDHWQEVVARWNAQAPRQTAATTIEDFHRYLLEAQGAREAGAPWPEDVRPDGTR